MLRILAKLRQKVWQKLLPNRTSVDFWFMGSSFTLYGARGDLEAHIVQCLLLQHTVGFVLMVLEELVGHTAETGSLVLLRFFSDLFLTPFLNLAKKK